MWVLFNLNGSKRDCCVQAIHKEKDQLKRDLGESAGRPNGLISVWLVTISVEHMYIFVMINVR